MVSEDFLRTTFAKETRVEMPSGRTLSAARQAMRNTLREAREASPMVGAMQGMLGDLNRMFARFGDFVQGPMPDLDDAEIALYPVSYAKAQILGAGSRIRRGKVEYRVADGMLAAAHMGDEIITTQGQLNLTPFTDQHVLLESGAHARLEKLASHLSTTHFGVRLVNGRAVSNITKSLSANDEFIVHTATVAVQAHGTEFIAETISPTDSYVAVIEGVVAVKMGEQVIRLPAGMDLRAVEGETLQAQAIPGFSPGEIYLSRSGDTLMALAQRFDVNLYRITKANPHIVDPNMIAVGSVLLIPKSQIASII